MKAWVKENMTITAIIGLLIILLDGTVNILVLLRQVRTTETNTTIILQNSNAMAMLALGYYFVSSKRNKDDKANIQVDNIENVDGATLNSPEKKD